MKMCIPSFVYNEIVWKEAFTKVCGKVQSFWTKNDPLAPYVCTLWPSEATTDTMDMTGIPPHTTLLANTENLKCIIEDFKWYVTRDTKGLLKDKIDDREKVGPGFVQEILILTKIDEIITYNKVTTNQRLMLSI